MKKFFYTSSLVLLLSVSLYSQSWSYVGNAGLSESTANYLSFDIDSQSGDLFLAYQDLNFQGKLSLIKYAQQESSWDENPLISEYSTGYANFMDLQIGDDGLVNLSFVDAGAGDALKIVSQTNSGTFYIRGTVGNGTNYDGGYGINTIIKKDVDNKSYVISYANGVRFMTKPSSVWVTTNIVPNINITALSFDFIYGSGYTAYSNLDDAGKIDIQKLSSTEITETYDNVSDGLSNYIDLVINPLTLQPYVAFQDIANGGKVTVKKLNGDTWELVGEVAFTDGLSNYVDLAFDSNGNPFVAFQDVSFSNKLSVMTFDGTSWNYVGNRGVSSASASYCSIKLNSDGEIFVAFKDGSASNKASVMKYYAETLSTNDKQLDDFVIFPNPVSDKLFVKGKNNFDFIISNGVGQILKEVNNKNSADVSSLSKGIYFVKIIDGKNATIKKFIKK
ncbi:MAG: T9SS type A sorting domain-containing protein [Polaribacter sp.]|nr:T9SS type A sorting domain-containing protein [Polaribacter sp.]MDG2357490.1 T9SS type A sorting domain-containing protein [Polaribacter sp.]